MTNTTKISKKELMHREIMQHGENLKAIFKTKKDPYLICSQLRTMERKATIETTAQCNGYYIQPSAMDYRTGRADKMQVNEDKSDEILDSILKKVYRILSIEKNESLQKIIFINYDARGYALKIRPQYITENNIKIYQDWGGNGILAPDFTPNN